MKNVKFITIILLFLLGNFVILSANTMYVDANTLLLTDAGDVKQGTKNQPVMSLTLKANQNSVVWRGVKVDHTGTGTDNDINNINVYKDLNQNHQFDRDTTVPNGDLASPISATDTILLINTTDVFLIQQNGYLNIESEIIYFTVSSTAPGTTGLGYTRIFNGLIRGILNTAPAEHTINKRVYAVISDVFFNYDTGTYPGLISSGNDQYVSGTKNIMLNQGEVIDNEQNNPAGQAYFLAYNINKTASVQKTIGMSIKTTDYFFIDAPDQIEFRSNPPLDTREANISEYEDVLEFTPETVNTQSYQVPKDEVYQGDQSVVMLQFTLKTNYADALWNKLIVERIGIGVQNVTLASGTNADVSVVKIYYDANDNGIFDVTDTLISSGNDNFAQPSDLLQVVNSTLEIKIATQTITTQESRFFVTYDISQAATAGDQVGIKIAETTWFEFASQDTMGTNNIPFTSSKNSYIKPIALIVEGTDIAPAAALQLQQKVSFLKLNLKTDKNTMTIKGINFLQTGNVLAERYLGDGQKDLEWIGVYLDNGDGVFVSTQDTLIGNVIYGSNEFTSGAANITITSQTITTSGKTFFVAGNISEVDLTNSNNEGHMVGLKISNLGFFDRIPITSTDSYTNVYPIKSKDVLIKSRTLILMKSVSVSEYTNSASEVYATWEILPPTSSDVILDNVVYYVDISSTTDPEIERWTSIGAKESGSQMLTGLGLSHGRVYYVQFKAISRVTSTNETKIGLSKYAAVKVDLTPPTKPINILPAPVKEGKPATEGVFVLEWDLSSDPTPEEKAANASAIGSGVYKYEIQERADNNPNWHSIAVVDGSVLSFTIGSTPAKDINGNSLNNSPRQSGHFFYYRVRALNNAGSWSEWSDSSLPASTGYPEQSITNLYNYPNPFRSGMETTKIFYVLKENADVEVSIYDLLGNLVINWKLEDGGVGGRMGINEIVWNGMNENGVHLDVGAYILQIKCNGKELRTKIGIK